MPIRAPKTNNVLPLLLAVVLTAAACADRPPAPLAETGGWAVVLGPDPGFDPAAARDPWWRSPPRGASLFSVAELDGTPALEIDAPEFGQPTGAVIGRRLAVPLLAMPYLNWAWYLEPAVFGGGPGEGLDRGVRLSIGFYGGSPEAPQLTDHVFGTGPAGYPIHDRRIDITFGGIGAPRPEDSTQHMAAVDSRGISYELRRDSFGQAGAWKLEALDLAKLYKQFWPRDRMNLTQITFIAVGSLGGRPTLARTTGPIPLGYVAEISLTR
ncbi:MAG: hypothetical protein JO128_14830 [Alphaproteobacteria bacterium]|nr:hypothetical protein [Alphaproteobacteria bacterium]